MRRLWRFRRSLPRARSTGWHADAAPSIMVDDRTPCPLSRGGSLVHMPPSGSRRTRLWIYPLGLALIALSLAFASSSPAACGSCHAMQPYVSGLSESAHAGVHCYSCHAGPSNGGVLGFKVREVGRMYLPGLLGREVSGAATQVERSMCVDCHAQDADRIPVTGIRILHSQCAGTGSCDTCHSAVAHLENTRFVSEPAMEDCVACHRQSEGPVGCDTCHAEKDRVERLSSSPWAVTHGPGWERTHGMGDLRSCDMCHTGEKCAGCHGVSLPHPADFGATHPAAARAARKSCEGCHDVARFCDGCHGLKMPHPDGFLSEHATKTPTLDEPLCQKCHQIEDCQRCHTAHTHPGRTDGTLGNAVPGSDD